MAPVAGPGVFLWMLHHVSPYGVQLDIAVYRQQVIFGIRQCGFVSPFPQGSRTTIGEIDVPKLLASLRLHHTADTLPVTWRHQQMDMIGHQYIV